MIPTEIHPLEPFLPANAKLLMLGSFPPQKKRWSMDFYYPNLNNDMWRIMGLIFYHNRDYFLNESKRAFCRERIIEFLLIKGIALFDTAYEVRRLQDNASDKFLEIVQPSDIKGMLNKLPVCKAIVTTGEKATDTLTSQFNIAAPKVGSYETGVFETRTLRLYRMPSSSRAYPLKLERKAEAYKTMFEELGMYNEQ